MTGHMTMAALQILTVFTTVAVVARALTLLGSLDAPGPEPRPEDAGARS